jgi:hypothetical protein
MTLAGGAATLVELLAVTAKPEFVGPKELDRLPPRALVAFAARCARRVQSLFVRAHFAGGKHDPTVDEAIRLAEDFAAGVQAKQVAVAIDEVAEAVAQAAGQATRPGEVRVLEAAANAADAASAAYNLALHPTSEDAAVEAAFACAAACAAGGTDAGADLALTTRQDFDYLLSRPDLEDDPSIWPNEFGPL